MGKGLRHSFVLLVALTALAGAPSAQAGLLSGVLPGVLSPSDSPSECEKDASQPFERWGDSAWYVIVPGGSFESGARGWLLSGGARVVQGNESFYVRSASDRHSLALPAGSSATSPAACFKLTDWKMRFFVTGSGSVRVKVVVRSALGLLTLLEGGTVAAGSSWQPSPEMHMVLSNVGALLATDAVSFRFTPVGTSSVRIDDVFIDPRKVS